jgi:hypothetical protein
MINAGVLTTRSSFAWASCGVVLLSGRASKRTSVVGSLAMMMGRLEPQIGGMVVLGEIEQRDEPVEIHLEVPARNLLFSMRATADFGSDASRCELGECERFGMSPGARRDRRPLPPKPHRAEYRLLSSKVTWTAALAAMSSCTISRSAAV